MAWKRILGWTSYRECSVSFVDEAKTPELFKMNIRNNSNSTLLVSGTQPGPSMELKQLNSETQPGCAPSYKLYYCHNDRAFVPQGYVLAGGLMSIRSKNDQLNFTVFVYTNAAPAPIRVFERFCHHTETVHVAQNDIQAALSVLSHRKRLNTPWRSSWKLNILINLGIFSSVSTSQLCLLCCGNDTFLFKLHNRTGTMCPQLHLTERPSFSSQLSSIFIFNQWVWDLTHTSPVRGSNTHPCARVGCNTPPRVRSNTQPCGPNGVPRVLTPHACVGSGTIPSHIGNLSVSW